MTELSAKMYALADLGSVRWGDELRARAEELEAKAAGFFGEPQTVDAKSFLGAWARARKLYCEVTGEPLV